ncbi:hypothetical protein [Pelagibacterium halotolerans]|uniref:Transmembrane protein n=1 Tax=Pelagibacterium halotolerans (strain DSM 22347 / JCM 15775 / CGMCC 1.7692 / B2) TaxID=1082931 RepID=G4R715_PELHB|nr:hypothetical protein [Pelagibacterium halotolerans]AEQ50169.1 hypothetical protein KKY_122 [Pelagibacterium halotolerans B2]QJR19823.1 hypothetical protein HKM20_16120 [Pelagibacterium halotolerans]SEA49608.1 hypothetical protein SAMN05428936_104205 [Pelagibacterium halotolerans]
MTDTFFRWIESSDLSTWVRSAPTVFAFPTVLVFHALGMGLAVGVPVVLALRSLGVSENLAPRALAGFLPVFVFGFILAVGSGLLLVIAYPTKALTNPVFYVKMAALLLGAAATLGALRTFSRTQGLHMPPIGRLQACGAALLMAMTITAGRYLAYTYSRLTVDFDRLF